MSAVKTYLEKVSQDLAAQSPKVPVNDFEITVDQISGQLLSPDWFQYMIYGRGPGKRPPFQEPNNQIEKWIGRNPDVLAKAKQTFKYITPKGLAYIIGRKIGNEGTRLWRGEAQGIDFTGALDRHLEELLNGIGEEESIKFNEALTKKIK